MNKLCDFKIIESEAEVKNIATLNRPRAICTCGRTLAVRKKLRLTSGLELRLSKLSWHSPIFFNTFIHNTKPQRGEKSENHHSWIACGHLRTVIEVLEGLVFLT